MVTEQIKQTASLADEEKQRLFGWGEDIFGVTSLNLRWRPKDVHFLMYSDGQLVSHVGILKHEVSVNGKLVTVGGVGAVVTVPEAQKKGFASRLMQHAAEFFDREWKTDAGLLFCLPKLAPYYEALGWRATEGPVLIDQPNGRIVSPLHVMVLPLGGGSWSAGEVELRSLPW